MSETDVPHILRRFHSAELAESAAAWDDFLDEYAPLIYQVVRHFETDPDRACDSFQHVCQQLAEGQFLRLRKFDPGGPAKFRTWLRAVVRNLCLDRRRKEFGRTRVFRSIARLSTFDQAVFRQIYERGASVEEAALSLSADFNRLTPTSVGESIERIEKALNSGQRWRLARRAEPGATTSTGGGGGNAPLEPADPRPSPEAEAILRERRAALDRALARLPDRDRLLVRLRFEDGLTLERIAGLLDLGNAQRADRRLKDVLSGLRRMMESTSDEDSGGKKSSASVKVLGKRTA